MAIHEADPWRLQYFADVPCPDDVHVPTEDADAWQWYPAQHWIYDRLAVARSQGLRAAPHGVMPDRFPVFSKPIVNLRGMGVGSQRIGTPAAYHRSLKAGHFWMELLTGAHVSSDFAVQEGRAMWARHTIGTPAGRGTFDHWIIDAAGNPGIEDYCGDWIARCLPGYTGMLNIETIGGRIIEAHLRFADQWPDLNGRGWVEAVIALYATGRWQFDDSDRRTGFSVVLFGPNGRRYRHPDARLLDGIRRRPGISSLQITFHEDRDPRRHAMPPGGFRLAIVNCHDLEAGRHAREVLRESFLAQIRSDMRAAELHRQEAPHA
ncbi:MAG: hypothetical protein JSR21_17925 [Proteobacteria bacterium]|nr:hypothetical protein [Pseudomonadota bacterium]